MNSTSDHDLIARCLSGQTEAFGLLVERYQSRLIRSLSSVLGSAEDALDICQDAFVLAYEKLGSFRGDSAFYSWLFRIAMNAAATARRKHRKVTISVDEQRETSGFEPMDHRDGLEPSSPMMLLEQRSLVQRALRQIPEEFRTALVLKEMEGLKYEQIAEMLDCPIGTVRSRIHRARQELRGKLRSVFRGEGAAEVPESSEIEITEPVPDGVS